MMLILKEILMLLGCIYLFLVLRSYYSKGETFKESLTNNLGFLVAILMSPVTWIVIIVAIAYVVYHLIH